MGRHLILDTNFLIDFERGAVDRTSLDDDTLAIAAISAAEFRQGIELADTPERSRNRLLVWEAIAGAITILDYTPATAVHHAKLLAHTQRTGHKRGAHDLIIASHAAETGRQVLSRDTQARFGDLPGVSLATH